MATGKAMMWAAAAAVICGALFFVAALAWVSVPRRAPAVPTSLVYEDLVRHRAIRSEVRGEPLTASVRESAASGAPAPVAAEAPLTSPVDRLRVPALGIDADLVTLGLLGNGEMDVPSGPKQVGWYGFTGKPGLGENAVFSGHVDYVNYGPAVFYNLKKLVQGDAIEVRLKDGTVIQYAVTLSHLYPVRDIPMAEVVGSTRADVVTLITCGGTFAGGEYTDRLVVRAVKTGVIRAQ